MKGDEETATGHGYGVALPSNEDGGALFVLESKGNWKHAGFHLSTSIVAPALLSLPYAMKGLGWAPGLLALVIGAAVSFYAYTLVSRVLEQAELEGHRLLRSATWDNGPSVITCTSFPSKLVTI
jgi:hypothetical protein